MKLTQKINRHYATNSFAIFLVAGVVLFFILKNIVNEDTDVKLENTYEQIELLIKNRPQTLDLYPTITVTEVLNNPDQKYFSDTTLLIVDEMEEYRQLVGYATINNVHYKITVRELGIESQDLFTTLAIVTLFGFSFLILSLYIINRKIAQTTWLPYFQNLEKLKQFSLQTLTPFDPVKSDTNEFNEMNVVLKSLTDKVISDYDNLKKFSENASHELQTPLAIIRSKIESLMDENSLSSMQVEKIHSIYQSVNRLAKINSGLVLLTKIENGQFSEIEQIDLSKILKQHIENFSELIEIKELKLQYNETEQQIINGNKILIELLINNILGNAILHSIKGDDIIIMLNKNVLQFSNSGQKIITENDRLFERFYKSGPSASTGLGLAISKQICIALKWDICYSFKNQYHIFKITF